MATLFVGCDSRKERANIVFYYPSVLQRDPDEVADSLQAAFDLMASQFPTPSAGFRYSSHFSSAGRVNIGYRRGRQHKGDGKPIDDEPDDRDLSDGYFPGARRINVRWNLLWDGDSSHGFKVDNRFEPEYCCGHELGHVFEDICLKGNNNRDEWAEGLCDFTRILLLKEWARRNADFGPVCEQYERYIMSMNPDGFSNNSNERRYHFAAQLILKWFRTHRLDLCFRNLKKLFDGDMTKLLGTWRTT